VSILIVPTASSVPGRYIFFTPPVVFQLAATPSARSFRRGWPSLVDDHSFTVKKKYLSSP
jgi:hypothetical protein